MRKGMKKILKSNFIFDLDAIKDFVFVADEGRDSEVEITEQQTVNPETGKLETETRIVREVKSVDSSKPSVRYDLIKYFMDSLLDVEIVQDYEQMTLGQNMIFNTMANYGLIKEINRRTENDR